VFRRIEQAEARLGAKLFERSRSGWAPNPRGEAVARAAAEMESAALGAERAISGADERLEGTIRIATSELLAGHLLLPLLRHFLDEHPGIEIECDVSNRNVDLTRREADMAMRATMQPPEMLVGRRIAVMRYAVFASKAMMAGRRGAPVLAELPWVGFDERIAHFQIAKWFRDALPQVRPRLRLDSMTALMQAAAAGIGAVVLPTFAAAQEPALLRVTTPIEGPEMGLWLLNHPDVRQRPRAHARRVPGAGGAGGDGTAVQQRRHVQGVRAMPAHRTASPFAPGRHRAGLSGARAGAFGCTRCHYGCNPMFTIDCGRSPARNRFVGPRPAQWSPSDPGPPRSPP